MSEIMKVSKSRQKLFGIGVYEKGNYVSYSNGSCNREYKLWRTDEEIYYDDH